MIIEYIVSEQVFTSIKWAVLIIFGATTYAMLESYFEINCRHLHPMQRAFTVFITNWILIHIMIRILIYPIGGK